MNYKKLVSLLAVSTLALAACDTDEEPVSDPEMEEEGTDEVEETDVEETEETEESAHDIIDDIDSDLDYTSSIELTVSGGTWSQEGYVFTPEGGEATISGSATSSEVEEETEEAAAEIFAFVMQDGVIIDKPEVEEGAFTYTVSATDADQMFQVGVSDEDLGEVGDEANAEDLVRYENVIVSASQGE